MSSKYKYLHTTTQYLIPSDVTGKSRIVEVNNSIKPVITKSISDTTHEISDDELFYTSITGKYNCIIYQFDDVQVVKYKPYHSLCYNFCVKSNKENLTFKINDENYQVLSNSKFPQQSKHLNFDPQDFFNFHFDFFDISQNDNVVFYTISDGKLLANISDMIIDLGSNVSGDGAYAGRFSSGKLYLCGDLKHKNIINEQQRSHIVPVKTNHNVVCFEYRDQNKCNYMIWCSSDHLSINAYLEGTTLKHVGRNGFVPAKIQATIKNPIQNEIYKIYVDITTNTAKSAEAQPNLALPNSEDEARGLIFNSNVFGKIENFEGTFDLMIKIHRNIIRNLYEKYLYIDILDIGIGKCRDVYTYQKYINWHSIYGVEPNLEFSRACHIKNIFNETADSIFKYFKLKGMRHKFHTIVFCNSYNFVTDPYITLKECCDALSDSGRIIMVYMNNDKVVTTKNKYYEIRKGEPNPELPDKHVLKNKQNFIQVFTETTLVPPHYENQISENDILEAVKKVNQDGQHIEVIDKNSLVHDRSEWLSPEAKLFNSMFYYCVLGKKCEVNKVIIAIDPNTTTLRDYINYLRKRNTYCNGVDFVKFIATDMTSVGMTPGKSTASASVILIDSFDNYNALVNKLKSTKQAYDTLINIQTVSELEYTSIYKTDIDKFCSERKKILDLNPTHSKFGIFSKE